MGQRDSGETQTVAPAAAPAAGDGAQLGDIDLPSRFTPIKILGAGAMGYVVEARDESLGREVAVKVIAPRRLVDAQTRSRFLREARAVATLRHENIVTVHDLDPSGKFLVMELVRGETLKQRIARDGRLAPDEVRRIGAALLAALGTAHDAGIVHRDVKPANILLGEDGSVKLADFGVATTHDSELTRTGEVIGTPAYMAPEQLRGLGSDPLVDIYAAGAMLFEAATGERLHAQPDRRVAPDDTILTATGDRGLALSITRAVAEQPGERWVDARSFAQALVTPVRAPRPRRDRRWWFAGGLVVMLGLSAAVLTRGGERGRGDRPAEASSFQRGFEALEQQDFPAAEKHLRLATRGRDAAKAHYYLAIQYWWTSHATAQVLDEIDKALAAGLDERLASVAQGVRALVRLEYPQVIGRFEALAQRFPRDRDVLYGLFEARFHGGRPVPAMEAYHRLRDAAPQFTLGRHHALGYYLSRGDLDRTRWVLEGTEGVDLARWEARIAAGAGRYREAKQRIETARATERGAEALAWELVAIHAIAGELEQAREVAVAASAQSMQVGSIALLGISLARGTMSGNDAIPNLWRLAISAANLPPSLMSGTRDSWVELATLIAIDGGADHARTALAQLPEDLDDKMLEPALARAMLSGAIGDTGALGRFASNSPFPEVRAVAEALAAGLTGDHRAAAEAWRRALAADGFGRFRIAESIHLARALVALRDHDEAIAACEPVIRPRLFHWSWGAAVCECWQITAKAHRHAGRIAESRRASQQILELRAGAPTRDALVAAARANLAR